MTEQEKRPSALTSPAPDVLPGDVKQALWLADNMGGEPMKVLADYIRRTLPQPAPESAWLIERGPNEMQLPHVWLMADWEWTYDANKAMKFATKEAAADHVATRHPPPFNDPTSKRFWPHAITEHSFLNNPSHPAPATQGVEELQARYDELMRLCGSEKGACADALGVAGDALTALRQVESLLREAREKMSPHTHYNDAKRDKDCEWCEFIRRVDAALLASPRAGENDK